MLKLACSFVVSSLFIFNMNSEPYRQTLTSAARNIHLDAWRVTSRDLNLKSALPWSVQKYTLHGGKQEGVDVIVVDNGKLTLTVIPTRGMGVAKVVLGDVRLGWDSPVKEMTHPQFVNLQSRGGLGWLEGFNEWMVRCGLEWAGHPGKDKFINNTGDEAEMDLTLHGKIGNIPASEVEVVIDREAPHRIHVRGRVDERMFYGPKLELWTEISTELGASTYHIEDEIKNYGAYEQEFQLIYHTNYGPPLLEAGSRFVVAASEVRPFNAHAAKSLEHFADYVGPTKGFVEQVYGVVPYVDENNRATVLLQNAKADKGVTVSYRTDQLPYFTLWKNTTAVEEGYVTGLEPGTGYPANRSIERQGGRVPKLKPNESRKFMIDFAILSGREQVDSAAAEIVKAQGGRQVRFNPQPIRPE